MAVTKAQRIYWEGGNTDDGIREYLVRYLVTTNDIDDGPTVAMEQSGLPIIGSRWSAIDKRSAAETTGSGWRTNYAKATPHQQNQGEGHFYWIVEHKYSTKTQPCSELNIDDPTQQPPRIRGSFVKYTEEVTHDKSGNVIESQSHEPLRGPQVEFDRNRATIVIEQNLKVLNLKGWSAVIDHTNVAEMWFIPKGHLKFSNMSFEKVYSGVCDPHYAVVFEFDIRRDGFNRTVLDEGTKALGAWDPTTKVWVPAAGGGANPSDWQRYRDKEGELAQIIYSVTTTGAPATSEADQSTVDVTFYKEANLFAFLPLPRSLTS